MSADHWYLQFPDIIEFCETMANKGKTVIVAALDGTFQRQVGFKGNVARRSFLFSSWLLAYSSGRRLGQLKSCVFIHVW